MRRALSQLDDDSRDVLELSYFAQLTQPEIADSLGISLATVRRNAARGLRVLAHRLEAELGYLSLEAYSTGPR